MIATIKNGIRLLQFSNLSRFTDLVHFTTTQEGGISIDNYDSFNLGFNSGDDPRNVSQNRTLLCNILDIKPDHIIFPKQTHSATIKIIGHDYFDNGEHQKKNFLAATDAVITNIKGICIGIKTADCVPILLFDLKRKVIAAIHAGWRGTVQNIANLTIKRMISEFDSDPEDIIAGIGPSISPEVYEVGKDVWTQFDQRYIQPNGSTSGDKRFLDLWDANRVQLIEAGVPSNQIELAGLCTYSNPGIFFQPEGMVLRPAEWRQGLCLSLNGISTRSPAHLNPILF